jgi:hypothetical protein
MFMAGPFVSDPDDMDLDCLNMGIHGDTWGYQQWPFHGGYTMDKIE